MQGAGATCGLSTLVLLHSCTCTLALCTFAPVHQFVSRLIRAVWLEPALYEEVEADRGANLQAFAVVLLSGVAAGVGDASLTVSVSMVVVSLVMWLIWALIVLVIGGKLFPEPQTHTDFGEVIRVLGFSTAPGLLRVFGLLPVVGPVVFVVTGVWMLAAMVVAIRQALDYRGILRALGVAVIAWLILIVIELIRF